MDKVHSLDQDSMEKADTADKVFNIQIDRQQYKLTENRITGADLRRVPENPIPPERDIFQIIPGHNDQKIENDTYVRIDNGLRFFTVPSTINPGIAMIGH